ncbi:uncharacterized protein LOC124137607 [Haliotis rufescens]|uniref:uncharacterized protein LOC124137607 n=1 Tax=Haliotis rufescens TaxID=6454 RepID=UPI00201FA0D9|nr:uncharacterized protein LOC124137607 [Haliotis rufescens]
MLQALVFVVTLLSHIDGIVMQTTPAPCRDVFTSCHSDSCNYGDYSLLFCKQTCGLCGPVVKKPPSYVCKDILSYALCRHYASGCTVQGDQIKWAIKYCPRTCQLCADPPTCQDNFPTDCRNGKTGYGCEDGNWGHTNCRFTCGLCGNECIDRVSSCSSRPKEMCQGFYEEWARNNCALSCGFCNSTLTLTTSKTNINTFVPTPYPIGK